MLFSVVARGGVEPPTFRFSVGRSYQLSYLAVLAETPGPTGGATIPERQERRGIGVGERGDGFWRAVWPRPMLGGRAVRGGQAPIV